MQDYAEEEKAYIFERASLIVLPIGAGMTNLIWAAGHAKVVFLCAPSLQASDVMGQSSCDWPREWFVGQYLSHKKMQAVVLRHGKLAAAADQHADAAAAGGEGGGGSNDGNPVAWLQPSAYGGERRHHPVRATCLIGAGRQGQSILKQCEPATSQLPVCERSLERLSCEWQLLRLWSDSKPGLFETRYFRNQVFSKQAACFWTFLFGD